MNWVAQRSASANHFFVAGVTVRASFPQSSTSSSNRTGRPLADGRGSRPPSDSPRAAARPTPGAHRPRSVRALPIASRSTKRPSSFVWERKISPDLVDAPHQRLVGLVVAVEAEAHDARTASERRPPSRAPPRTQLSNSCASRTCSRIIACSPSRPKQRSVAHSFSERNRRPSTTEYSLRLATSSVTRRYSGTRLKARRKSSGLRVQRAEQSIGVASHLCGFVTIESPSSHPAKRSRSSGQTAAAPA